MGRPTPFDLVLADYAADRFPEIRNALVGAGADPRNRDAFVVTLPAMTLLRDLRPDEEEAGEGVLELTALIHHAYLHWADGLQTRLLPADEVRFRLGASPEPAPIPAGAAYLQLPERLVWASLGTGGAWEPLDGCYVHAGPDGALRVLGVFGVHPSRMGFTVAEATGRPGMLAARSDGAPLFSPALAGGAEAALYALVEPGELVELAGRLVQDERRAAARREAP